MTPVDNEDLEKISNCALCANMCKHSCPTYLSSGKETITPQKMARLILYKRNSLIEDEQGFYDVMFQSAMCGACKAHCIYDNYDLRNFIHNERCEAFVAGMLPDETRKRVETYRRFGNPHGERPIIRKGMGSTGYFISCSAYNDNQLLDAVDKIAAMSTESINQFGGADICCGAPLYYAGDLDGFLIAATKMKGDIESRKLRKVISNCPNCIKMMTEIYQEVGVYLDVEFVPTISFLHDLLNESKIKINRANKTATFHDPCIVVNDLGITTTSREVLQELGFQIKEPVYSQKDTHCCGGLCGTRIADCNLTEKVKEMRIRELKETDATVYISACPTCKAVLSDIDMRDITEIVAQYIGDA